MNVAEVSSAVTALGVAFAGFQLMQSRKQRRREFEDVFVQRFWSLMDRLTVEGMKGLVPSHGLHSEDERAALAYFRLCEDELELWHLGWISRATWAIWALGINTMLTSEPFKTVWKDIEAREAATSDSAEQFALLRRHQADVCGLERVPWWRRLITTG